MDWYTLDENENPIPWDYFEESSHGRYLDNKTVWPPIQETVGDYWVSTVFLGLDHSFGQGLPTLWETMIFIAEESDRTDNEHEYFQQRYTSADAARHGHAETVVMVKAWQEL